MGRDHEPASSERADDGSFVFANRGVSPATQRP
jgi:hypothetical protein